MYFSTAVCFTLANLACQAWPGGDITPPAPVPLIAACESTGISPTRKSIVTRLENLVPNPALLARWELAISQLGSTDFNTREKATLELMTQGPALRSRLLAAKSTADPEIIRRVDEIAESLPFRQQEAWLETAIAWLAQNPDEFLQGWLLAYLPWVEQTEPNHTSQWLLSRLLECSSRINRWEWVQQVQPRSAPLLRLAAAQSPNNSAGIAGQNGLSFIQEQDPRIRFVLAKRQFAQGSPDAAKELANLLLSLPESEALEAEALLQSHAGPAANGSIALMRQGKLDRVGCSRAWLNWLDRTEGRSTQTLRAGERKTSPRTLVVEFDGPRGGRIQELGPDWKPLWSMEGLSGPNSVQFLNGGNILVAERTACRVTERTPGGQIRWEHALAAGPISAIRTDFGTTVIATFQEVTELDAVGRELRKHTHSSGFREVKSLQEGTLRCVTGDGTIQFLNEGWQVTHMVKPERHSQGAAYWASVSDLSQEKLLVSLGGTGKLLEINKEGRISWEAAVPAVVHAQRLPNGNTLVCSFDGRALIELDSHGKEVGKLSLEGRPFMAIRR